MSLQHLMKLDNLIESNVIKRPSIFIKSPYVADIKLGNESVIAHTASLGCCGLVDINSTVMMSKNKNVNSSDKRKCKYKIYLSIIQDKNNEIIIGVDPKIAENLVENAIKNNYLTKLKYIKKYCREKSIYVKDKVDSRFDFMGIDCDGIPFIMEVKNVPLADYEDTIIKNKNTNCYDNRRFDTKVAYFPDGYRKKRTDTVSPRALKHIKELTYIKTVSKTRCLMCYVIQRDDVNRFQPSVVDPEYREAVKNAFIQGVEFIAIVIKWDKTGNAYFIRDDLPIII